MDVLTVHHHLRILDKTMYDLEDLCYRLPSLIPRQSAQPLNNRLHFLLAKKPPNSFFFIHKSGNNPHRHPDDGLTKLSLPCLFGRRRECEEQLHENLDNHVIHGFCRRDLGIDLDVIEDVPNRLEQIGQDTVII